MLFKNWIPRKNLKTDPVFAGHLKTSPEFRCYSKTGSHLLWFFKEGIDIFFSLVACLVIINSSFSELMFDNFVIFSKFFHLWFRFYICFHGGFIQCLCLRFDENFDISIFLRNPFIIWFSHWHIPDDSIRVFTLPIKYQSNRFTLYFLIESRCCSSILLLFVNFI